MSAKTMQYKDTLLSMNSDLFKLLQSNEHGKAEKMYKELSDAFHKANPGWKPYPPKN